MLTPEVRVDDVVVSRVQGLAEEPTRQATMMIVDKRENGVPLSDDVVNTRATESFQTQRRDAAR